MIKKYEILEHDSIDYSYEMFPSPTRMLTHEVNTLYRIRALIDFGDVKAGQEGGYIESEANLSQRGNCWVYYNAIIKDSAKVSGNAKICDNAVVTDRAKVSGNAKICDNARLEHWPIVRSNAIVCDNAVILRDAEISGNTMIKGSAIVDYDVCGNTIIDGTE